MVPVSNILKQCTLLGWIIPVVVKAKFIATGIAVAIVVYEYTAYRTFVLVHHEGNIAGTWFRTWSNGNLGISSS